MDKDNKCEIEKSKVIEKGKSKEFQKKITELKSYKIPDAINKKYFDKINIYNFIGILKFIYFSEMIEISFVNQNFYNLINRKYPKRIPIIKKSFKTLKKAINFNFSEDFNFNLRKNSAYITDIIRKMIESEVVEYFPKMGVKKYFFNKVKSNPEITKLCLGKSDIGKKSIKYLSYYFDNKNCNINNIDISENKISGDILGPFAENPNIKLQNLIANKCFIDLKTFVNLSKINIEKLSLNNNNIDDELISKLINNNIKELNISYNCLTNEGIFNICKNLPNLRKLNLANNNICDLSLLYISLYIKNQKQKLSSLNLKDNKITITGLITLASTFEKINKNNTNFKLKKLNLSGNLLDLVPIPKRLGTQFLNVYIKKLCLGNHTFNINDLNILLSFINNISNITVLDLSKSAFDNVSLNLIFKKISENLSLKKLKLKYCYLGNTEVNNTLEIYYTKSDLKKEKNKKQLIENKNNIINENDEILYNNENYIINNINKEEEKINEIENNIINNKNDYNIETTNTNNIIINNHEKNNIINKNEINNINECISVESFDLGYNFINYGKLGKIILSDYIKELNIEGNDLHLWGNDIYLFFDFIINNKVLEILILNKNNLQKMANKFLEKINDYNIDNNSNCSLKYLSLEDNQIKDINLELINLLSNNKNLEYLNLQNNLIGNEIGNNYFFHSLFKNKKSLMKQIDISNNKITLNFIVKLIKYSKENIIEKKNCILNITSKQIREEYLNSINKENYRELVNLKNIKCL